MSNTKYLLKKLEISVQFVKEQIESGIEETEMVQQELIKIIGEAVQLSDAISEEADR
ncbi:MULTISPECIES: hypothetical protein [Enterococcus]|uniref:hypothetical protein n=1 Tax=Enterococcus TaxID=1350 RepID=UPI00159F6818|nr:MULTISPECIES: hypothetical protein [Enterococcus]DAT60382.1 MAG TPA: hypothetical protein [Caudoviricetes sp.]